MASRQPVKVSGLFTGRTDCQLAKFPSAFRTNLPLSPDFRSSRLSFANNDIVAAGARWRRRVADGRGALAEEGGRRQEARGRLAASPSNRALTGWASFTQNGLNISPLDHGCVDGPERISPMGGRRLGGRGGS